MKAARLVTIAILLLCCAGAWGQRRISPVETPATATQAINETATDTARINARRRAASISYVDDRGLTIYVDTITNTEWTDSAALRQSRVPRMQVPLWHTVSVGIDIWDPVMRIFGQQHGIAGAWAQLSLHNRYKPIIEAGLGAASHRASTGNFLYRSPLSFFMKIGADYNFLYNSNPDYQFTAGLRYGVSPFSYSVDDVRLPDSYWGETATFNIPAQHVTVGWFEVTVGLRVKLWGPVSAGWQFKFHSILHQSAAPYGRPWYIPGYGTRGTPITGSFSVVYTIPLSGLNKKADPSVDIIESEAPPVQQEQAPQSATQ